MEHIYKLRYLGRKGSPGSPSKTHETNHFLIASRISLHDVTMFSSPLKALHRSTHEPERPRIIDLEACNSERRRPRHIHLHRTKSPFRQSRHTLPESILEIPMSIQRILAKALEKIGGEVERAWYKRRRAVQTNPASHRISSKEGWQTMHEEARKTSPHA